MLQTLPAGSRRSGLKPAGSGRFKHCRLEAGAPGNPGNPGDNGDNGDNGAYLLREHLIVCENRMALMRVVTEGIHNFHTERFDRGNLLTRVGGLRSTRLG
ncbi:MAG TPA: hypothetical protein PKZ32_12630, partial [Candidatus Melainabacteria bacterium]|nr:hypothetical protein [Candidatus Melainabacteria bacterium]